ASALAERINGTYLEGDSFHSAANKAKMGNGTPLTDEDRWPWFDTLAEKARECFESDSTPVLSCSALKRAYRDRLFDGFAEPRLVYLHGDFDLIKRRMDERDHEYMTSELLRSQFSSLEVPSEDEAALQLSIEASPKELIDSIVAWLA
ncbi:MAG: gluconokinase, GntK/IdnK-type, partial [Verrucomicrobiota bacterium]